jgi:hypothetical protein
MQSPLAFSIPTYLSSVASTLGKITEANHVLENISGIQEQK